MSQKEALMKAQLDFYLQLDLTPLNIQHLKELKFENPTLFLLAG
jgi:hypothetical protein